MFAQTKITKRKTLNFCVDIFSPEIGKITNEENDINKKGGRISNLLEYEFRFDNSLFFNRALKKVIFS